MTARHQKLNTNIDLFPYKDLLLNRPGDPRYCPIDVDLLTSIVPKLDYFNKEMTKIGWSMFKPKTMVLSPGAWGGLHIDASKDGTPLSLSMNIPIMNGTSMITRWYSLPHRDDLIWRSTEVYSEYTSQDATATVDNYCVDYCLLDGVYVIKTDEPHNVDGRHSKVNRGMISIRWVNNTTKRLLSWDDREILVKMSEIL